jgi:hypothetical protein
MRVLVTAATKYRATTEIAQAIAEVLGEHGLEPTVLPPAQVEGVDGYDAAVVGSAVYAGHWLKPGRELVERHAGALAGRCGCSPAARLATRPSRRRIRWMWPTSRLPLGPVTIGCSPASWSASSSAFPSGRSSRPCGSPRGTSATGSRSASGRPGSPMPWEPAPSLGRTGPAVTTWADRRVGDLMADGRTSNELQALVDVMRAGSGTPRPATRKHRPLTARSSRPSWLGRVGPRPGAGAPAQHRCSRRSGGLRRSGRA